MSTSLTPSQAFSVAEKEKIDLVVSDVNLEANQSGLDLLKDLRAQCPVILVTGFGTLDSAVEAAREGAARSRVLAVVRPLRRSTAA